MPKTKDALKIIDRMIGQDQVLQDLIDEETINVRVARMIYDARNEASLTQKELAKLVGTTQSVIARLEDADYEGHSLNMLNRIATALKKRVDIRLVSLKKTHQHARVVSLKTTRQRAKSHVRT
jgi:predicted transcriptional regulator